MLCVGRSWWKSWRDLYCWWLTGRRTVEKLNKFCDVAAMTEIEKYMEDLEVVREEVEEAVKERGWS